MFFLNEIDLPILNESLNIVTFGKFCHTKTKSVFRYSTFDMANGILAMPTSLNLSF